MCACSSVRVVFSPQSSLLGDEWREVVHFAAVVCVGAGVDVVAGGEAAGHCQGGQQEKRESSHFLSTLRIVTTLIDLRAPTHYRTCARLQYEDTKRQQLILGRICGENVAVHFAQVPTEDLAWSIHLSHACLACSRGSHEYWT